MTDSILDPSPPAARLVLDLLDLTEAGKEFAGEIEGDIFQLEADGPRFQPPLRYELRALEMDGGGVVVTGKLSADFTFTCVRCLEEFTDRLQVDDWAVEVEWNPANSPSIDLTDLAREDILLALPGYPRCEEGQLHPRNCPAAQRFSPDSAYSPLPSEEEEASARRSEQWSALDQLNIAAPDTPPASGATRKHP